MAVGLISKEDFLLNAEQLCRLSDRINDDWKLEKIQEETVLCKTIIQQIIQPQLRPTSDSQQNDLMTFNDESLDVGLEDDSACLQVDTVVDTESKTETLKFEYHIVYSESYSVPVLYLNVNKSDGKLISLEELWDLIPQAYRDRLKEDRWTFLTQQEHPLLGRPFFQLHPCHTGKLMENVQKTMEADKLSDSSRNYLVTWLSSIGPVVHLKLPFEYGTIT